MCPRTDDALPHVPVVLASADRPEAARDPGHGRDRRRACPRLRGYSPRRDRHPARRSLAGGRSSGCPTPTSPPVSLLRRLAIALGALVLTALIVYFGRDGYRDAYGDAPIGLADAFYYATVSLSTTGYGDIVPVSDGARLITTIVVTPLRLLFLITFVGTTVELLTERSRQSFRIQRWRSRVRDHTVVVGYGTKGRAAVETLLGDGAKPTDIVVVDTDRTQPRRRLGRGARDGHRQRHAVQRAADRGRAAGLGDRGGHQPRRHRGAGHPDGAGAARRTSASSRRCGSRRTCTCCGSPAPTRWSSPRRRRAAARRGHHHADAWSR